MEIDINIVFPAQVCHLFGPNSHNPWLNPFLTLGAIALLPFAGRPSALPAAAESFLNGQCWRSQGFSRIDVTYVTTKCLRTWEPKELG